MTTEITPLPATVADHAGPEHHTRPAPMEHLCTCGRLREACVRETVRDLWLESEPC